MPRHSAPQRRLPALRTLRIALAAVAWLSADLSTAQPQQLPNGLASAIADARLASWNSLITQGDNLEERAKLEAVNGFINRALVYGQDRDIWGEEDFWATPAQSISRGMGDCEDFAIAKYFSLVRMGVPSEKLRLTFVKELSQNQAHMVLAFYAEPQAEPLILDSLDPRIKPAGARQDLLPVYAFNNHGIFLANSPQQKSKQPPQMLSRWSDVSERAVVDGSQVPAALALGRNRS